MCSFLVQIIYGIVCAAAAAMTVTSLTTAGWTDFTVSGKNATGADYSQDFHQGILTYTCADPKDATYPAIFPYKDCDEWYSKFDWTESMVVVCMCLAAGFQAIAFVWNLFTICACCCKKYILHPLSLFTLLAAISLAISVITYICSYNNGYVQLAEAADVQKIYGNLFTIGDSVDLGYSFYLACGALALNIVNMIVSSFALCCAKRCC